MIDLKAGEKKKLIIEVSFQYTEVHPHKLILYQKFSIKFSKKNASDVTTAFVRRYFVVRRVPLHI